MSRLTVGMALSSKRWIESLESLNDEVRHWLANQFISSVIEHSDAYKFVSQIPIFQLRWNEVYNTILVGN